MTVSHVSSRFADLPKRMRKLPVDARGFPVPRFVRWFDEAGKPVEFGHGRPDFRVVDPKHFHACLRQGLCWICGEKLGRHFSFVVGPMCAVNRINSEPPSHRDCAIFAAKACPFLSHPMARRRDISDIENPLPPAGVHLDRNPGVACVWSCKSYKAFRPSIGGDGILFQLGEPSEVLWFAQGRAATFEEVNASIETGLPALMGMAKREANLAAAVGELERQLHKVFPLLPPRSIQTQGGVPC